MLYVFAFVIILSTVTGSDELKHWLKEFTNEIAPFLTIICQKSLITGAIAIDWKTTHLATLLHVMVISGILGNLDKYLSNFISSYIY
jgi:hypothetical protein